MKPGTKIEVSVNNQFSEKTWEPATIGEWPAGSKDSIPGYHPVIFSDGGALMVHENGFRVRDAA